MDFENIKDFAVFVAVLFLCTCCIGIDDPDATGGKSGHHAFRDNANGACGENVTWFYSDGVLIVNGTGEMSNYTLSGRPPYKKYSINTLFIEEGVSSIGNYAFAFFDGATNVTIPDSVTTIGEGAFYSSKVVNFVFGKTVRTIENDAFASCIKLSRFIVDERNEHFKARDGVLFDFEYSTLIRYPPGIVNNSYAIPDGVIVIGEGAFYGCRNLSSVVISDDVMTIKDNAFYCCTNLTDVTIGDGVVRISDSAFDSTYSLSFFTVKKGNKHFTTRDGVLFDITMTELIHFSAGTDNSFYIVPDSVKTIGSHAFYRWENTLSIVIPDSVTKIGDYAFYNCNGLASIIIPDSVTTIGEAAFTGCSALANVTIGNGVKTFGEYAFAYCFNLTDVIIGGTTIGEFAFHECDDLINVQIGGDVKTIEYAAFLQCERLTNLTISAGVETIRENSFADCNCLTSVIIPDSVTIIEESAFSGCGNLENVTIGNGVNTIGVSAFAYCYELKYVTFGTNVTTIGDEAFLFSGIEDLIIPDGVITIGDYAFSECYKLKNLVIPDSVTAIGDYSFLLNDLINVVIPDDVTVGESAFFQSSRLETLVIGENVSFIGSSSFGSCHHLKSVFYQGSVPVLTEDVFEGCDALESVCVSPSYKSPEFCCRNVTSNSELCQNFTRIFNQCYKGSFKNDELIPEKRSNATEWEKQSDSCFEYQCNNEIGFVKWSLCNSSVSVNRICVDGNCTDETFIEKKWIVEIEVNEIKSVDLPTWQIVDAIVELTGIKNGDIVVGIETGENGFVTKILVYTEKEEIANAISKAVNDMEKGESCKYGALCRTKSVCVRSTQSKEISNGVRATLNLLLILLLCFIHN